MIKGCLTLPRNDDFPKMLLESMNSINKARAEEILVEKGDRQILDVIRDAKEARDKKWEGTIRCAKCGVERPESQYDCKCGYSLGGD